MALLDLTSDNPKLSFILAKNPNTQATNGVPFERPLRKGQVFGWYLADSRTFRLWFKDADQEISFVSAGTDFEYLDQTRYSSPYAAACMVSELLGSALKAEHADDAGYPATLTVHAMLLPRPGLAPLFHRYLEAKGISLVATPLAGKLHQVVLTSVQGVRSVLNALIVFALLQALADKSLYVEANTPALQKYIRALNVIEAPYFMRYLFSRDAVQSYEQFRELAPTLAGADMRLNYGSTQQHRWDAIRVHLRGGDCLLDIGAGEGDTGRVGGDHGGERVDGGAQGTDTGSQQHGRGSHDRVEAGGHHHRHQQGVERQGLFRHAVDGAPCGEQRHQNGDHPLFTATQAIGDALDTGIDGTCLGHDAKEATDDQDEEGDVDGASLIGVVVVETVDGCQQHVDYPLGIGIHQFVGTGHRHFLAEGLVHGHLVFAGRHYPAQGGHQGDQHKQYRVG
jgi:hypothetical protein